MRGGRYNHQSMFKQILLCLLFSVLSLAKAEAMIVEVCSQCEQTSIVSGIAKCNSGDTLIIKSGTYKEFNIVIDKALTIIGDAWPIIDAEEKGEIITVTSDNVHISGIQAQNVGTSYLEDRAAIRIKKSKHFSIINNKLRNSFFGVYLEHSDDGIIADNEIIGEAIEEMSSGNAIHLWYCKNIQIKNNEVVDHRDGIYLEFVDNSLVEGNWSENNLRYGLHFMFSNNNDYFNNTFKNNGSGVAVMFSKKINMWDNLFEHNWGQASFGLLLKEIYDAEITHNVFVENTIGIYIEGSTRINYIENDFIQNGWALKIMGGCLDNNIEGNNFISNTFDLSMLNNRNQNTFDGNYWSDYTGYDLNDDGIGDVPYHPVKLFNYVVNNTPESIVLLRSLFLDLLNFSEKVSPVFTPKNVIDNRPHMKKLKTK